MSVQHHGSNRRVTASRKQKARAAATITVIGGSLVIDGQPASAATFDVTNTNASGPGSLAQAILDANAAPGPDVITFSGGGASGTITLDGAANKIDDDLTIVGPGESAVTLTSAAGSVLYVYNEADLTVSGLTIANVSGGSNANAIRSEDGGDLTVTDVTIDTTGGDGIFVSHDIPEDSDDVELTNVGVVDSGGDGVYINEPRNVSMDTVTVSGAGEDGIDVEDVQDLTILNTSITNSADQGTEIYPLYGDLVVTDSQFNENGSDGLYWDVDDWDENDPSTATITRVEANDNAGHGVAIYEGGETTLTDVRATGNEEAGLYVGGTYGDLTIENIIVAGNVDGGMYIEEGNGTLSIDGFSDAAVVGPDTVVGNGDGTGSAWSFYIGSWDGDVTASDVSVTGEFWIDSVAGDVDLENVSVARNPAFAVTFPQVYLGSVDGAVAMKNITVTGANEEGVLLDGIIGPTTIENMTVSESGNEAVVITNATGATTIINSTIGENDVSTAYIVRVAASDVNIAHTTIANNTQTGGSAVIGLDGTSNLTLDHTIVAGNGGAFSHAGGASTTAVFSLVETGSGLGGSNNETNDPKLGPLQDNGGPTRTVLPAADSPALDAGNPAITGEPATDQRGANRVVGSAIDVGAVEVDSGSLGVLDASAAESDGSVDVVITRTGPGDGAASVDVSTGDATAEAGVDYTAVSTTVNWASGDNSDKVVTVPLLADRLVEGDEQFIVNITNPTGATIGAGVNTANVTITDSVGPAIVSLAPQRFADTRPNGETFDNISEQTGKLAAGGEIEVDIAGRGGVPADAVGVVMNITAIQAEANGYVTAHPCVTPRPLTSSLNYTPGVNLGNEVISGLSADGSVCLFTSSAANLAVDVVGYITADSPLINVTPGRVLDTRDTGETVDDLAVGGGKTSAGGTTTLKIAGRANVPSDAAAVVVNVTAVGATGTGYVTVSPCVTPTPLASSLNYVAGVNRGNELVASLDADGNICLFTSSSVHLTVDVVGYLPGGTNYNPVEPARFLDSRPGESTIDTMNAGTGKLAAGDQVELQVAGRGDVPADATAVVMNVTAVQGEAVGFVTVHPCEATLPLASSLNFVPGVNGGNEIVAQLDADGKLCLYTSAAAHLTADVVGYMK
jgi:Calx-beta domain/Right handed beta helix region